MAELGPVHEVSLLRLLLAERRSRDQTTRCDWLRRQLIKQNVLMGNNVVKHTTPQTAGSASAANVGTKKRLYVTIIKSIK